MRLNSAYAGAFACLLIALHTSVAHAERSSIAVEAGWGGRVRPGSWNPVFVTVSSPKPTNVIVSIQTPHDSVNAMSVSVGLTATSTPTTFPLVIPLTYNLDKTRAVLTDAASGRILDDTAFVRDDQVFSPYQSSDKMLMAGEKFIGISGAESTQRVVGAQLENLAIKSSFMSQNRLPTTPAGYDALDVLMLSNANLITLAADQQAALSNWVRGGGCLVMWPSQDIQPESGDVYDILPGRFGENTTLNASLAELKKAGLGERFAKTRGRVFRPVDGTNPVYALGAARGARQRVGFGQVVALSFDVSQLQFDTPEAAREFWKPILSPMINLPDPANPNAAYTSADDARKEAALQTDMDMLGSIPGLGQFNFIYIAAVLSGLIVLVGPIDWFVLRKLNHQPLTWVTTTGWIVLVTFAAIFAGYWIKSGDLHLRTLRLVDQADGLTVATNDLVCIYSPKSAAYDLAVDPAGWWRPASPQAGFYSANQAAQTIQFHQDPHGNRVAEESLQVNIWNMKFVEAETLGRQPAVVDATVMRDSSARRGGMTCKLTNLTGGKLNNLFLRTKDGFWTAKSTVDAGATETIALNYAGEKNDQFSLVEGSQMRSFRMVDTDTAHGSTVEMPVNYAAAGDVARRSGAADAWIATDADHAVLYVSVENPAGVAKLNGETPIEKHWQVVRTLVEVRPAAK